MKKKENLFLTELALNAFLPFDDGEELLEKFEAISRLHSAGGFFINAITRRGLLH